jgi:hypothetical protein
MFGILLVYDNLEPTGGLNPAGAPYVTPLANERRSGHHEIPKIL